MVLTMVFGLVVPAYASTPAAEYTVTATYDSNKGHVSIGYPSGKSTAAAGETVRISTDANDGYVLKSITPPEGVTLTAVSGSTTDFTFVMPASNISVAVEFEEPQYAYTLSTAYEAIFGTVTLSQNGANKDDIVKVFVDPETDYVVDTVIARYGTNKSIVATAVGIDSYEFKMPAANTTVEVTFRSAYGAYDITLVNNSSRGDVSIVPAADKNDTVKIYVVPKAGYEVFDIDIYRTNKTSVTYTLISGSGYDYFVMPAYDVTVEVTYTTASGNYYVDLDYEETEGYVYLYKHNVSYGDFVNINYEAFAGYEIDTVSVFVTGTSTPVTVLTRVNNGVTNYFFKMPANDVTVSVDFKEYTGIYDVNLNFDGIGGDVTFNRSIANKGDIIKIYVDTDTNFSLSSLLVKDSDGSRVKHYEESDYYYFTMPEDDVTVYVELDEASDVGDYYVDIEDYNSECGSVRTSHNSADYRDTVTITITPNTGYYVLYVYVETDNGNDVSVRGTGKTRYFTMPSDDVIVSVIFAKGTVDDDEEDDDDDGYGDYTVSMVFDYLEGDIEIDKNSADEGEIVKIYTYPDPDYEVDDVYVIRKDYNDYVDVYSNGSYYYFYMPDSDVTVYVEFYAFDDESNYDGDYYIDLYFDEDYGTVRTTPYFGDYNDTVKIYVYPEVGYEVDSVVVRKENSTGTVTVRKSNNYYYFTMPKDDVAVYVEFCKENDDDDTTTTPSNVKHDIDLYYDEYYADVIQSHDTAKAGTRVDIEIDLVGSNTVKRVNVICQTTGESVTVKRSGTDYYFTMPDDDVFVDVVFKVEATGAYFVEYEFDEDQGTVRYSASMAGRATDVRFYVEPAEGYLIDEIEVFRDDNGRVITYEQLTNTIYRFTMPASDAVVVVTFKKEVVNYAVNVSTDTTMGTVTASTTVATAGTVISITPTPKTGYELDKITVTEHATNKPVSVKESNGVFTFTLPEASVNVNVNFKKRPVSYYIVSDYDNTMGKVTLSTGFATKGTTVTVTVKPEDEHEIVSVVGSYTSNGTTIICVPGANNTYTFTMPEDNVQIKVTMKQSVHVCSLLNYADVDLNEWYHKALDYVVKKGIMNGIGKDSAGKDYFNPKGTTTRAMVTTVLWRIAGSPKSTAALPYTDVPEGQWYTEAVRWAAANGLLINVTTGNKFEPNATIAREQFADVIYRFEQFKAGGKLEKPAYQLNFSDLNLLSDWAKDSMNWCNVNKIINGNANGTLNPKGSTTRAELAQILLNYKDFN